MRATFLVALAMLTIVAFTSHFVEGIAEEVAAQPAKTEPSQRNKRIPAKPLEVAKSISRHVKKGVSKKDPNVDGHQRAPAKQGHVFSTRSKKRVFSARNNDKFHTRARSLGPLGR